MCKHFISGACLITSSACVFDHDNCHIANEFSESKIQVRKELDDFEMFLQKWQDQIRKVPLADLCYDIWCAQRAKRGENTTLSYDNWFAIQQQAGRIKSEQWRGKEIVLFTI